MRCRRRQEVQLAIYTPYGYDPEDTDTLYPVLYLIPGAGTTYQTWFTGGWANNVFDNLVEEGAAEPAILVSLGLNSQNYLVSDIIGYVEENYTVYTDAAHRALAGTLMGGIATSNVLLDVETSGLFSSEYTATAPSAEAVSMKLPMISLRNTDTATIFDAPVIFVGSVRAMARQGLPS